MSITTRRLVALAGAVAVTFGAACSKAETPTTPTNTTITTTAAAPKAAEILAKVRANALAATSGAFKGEVEQGGSPMSIEFKGTADGKQADITVKADQVGGAVRIISVSDGVFMQADKAFWTKNGGAALATKFAGKWVKAPASMGGMASELSLKTLLDKAFGAVTSSNVAAEAKEETTDGVDCWLLVDKKGATEGAIYVSKDKFELVRFKGTTKSPGQLDFSQWNADLGIKAPAASEIVPLS
jgi:hypothetical protein